MEAWTCDGDVKSHVANWPVFDPDYGDFDS